MIRRLLILTCAISSLGFFLPIAYKLVWFHQVLKTWPVVDATVTVRHIHPVPIRIIVSGGRSGTSWSRGYSYILEEGYQTSSGAQFTARDYASLYPLRAQKEMKMRSEALPAGTLTRIHIQSNGQATSLMSIHDLLVTSLIEEMIGMGLFLGAFVVFGTLEIIDESDL